MRRTSTDADYLRDGTVQVDADGIPVDLSAMPRIDTSVGKRVFIKDTMIYGDTGWRDVSADLKDRTTPLLFEEGSGVRIRRIDNMVHLAFYGRIQVVSSYGNVLESRLGWRAGTETMIVASTGADMRIGTRNIRIENASTGTDFTLIGGERAIQWLTNDPWPTTLPGTPV